MSNARRGAWLLVVAALACRGAFALSGGLSTVAGHGLQLSTDTTWIESAGYLPIRVGIKPQGTVRADRHLRLEFRAQSYGSGAQELIVERDVVVPRGSQGISLVVPLLDAEQVHSVELHVFEDGRERQQLTMQLTIGGMQQWNEGLPRILFVGDSLPDHAPLAGLLPEINAQWASPYGANATNATSVAPTALSSVLHLPLDALPEDWINYSSLDVVSISWEKLRELAANRPAAWSAVRQWIRSGGNLWVLGVEPAARGELSGLLATAGDDWREAQLSERDDKIQDISFARREADATVISPDGSVEAIGEAEKKEATPAATDASIDSFVWRECGLGSVTALVDPQALPGSRQTWAWVLNTLGPDRWLHYRRHGLSVVRDNADFWNFLVPGVGLAPVTAFRLVITGFVLLIGPLNYFLLQRRGQLQWLLLTVPAGALIITSSMFAYAMFSDGITVRCRARGYTWLDQRTSATAVTCGRLSYYAGLAPSRGLRFTDQTAVLPLQSTPTNNDGVRSRRLIWLNDGWQWLQSGWLVSRRTTQFATTRVHDFPRGLRFRQRGDGALQVANELDSPLLGLLVCDADGRLHQILNPQGREFVLTPLAPDADLSTFLALLDRYPPALPPEIDQMGASQISASSRRYYWGWDQSQTPLPDFDTALMERHWTRLRSEIAGGKLRPRTYVAVLADTGDLELGTDEARPESSIHLVEGIW